MSKMRHKKLIKQIIKSTLMGCTLLSFISMSFALNAITHPEAIAIKNNDQATVNLSQTDINRLFVHGEKITAMNTPSGSINAHNDNSGSLYINVNQQAPFTTFITTNRGHHYALLIIPKSVPGQTIELKPAGRPVQRNQQRMHHASRAKRWERHSSYEVMLIQLIREAMQGHVPSGYTAIAPHALGRRSPLAHIPNLLQKNRRLKTVIQTVYLGGDWALRKLQVQNVSNKPLTLVSNQLNQASIKAVAIAKEKLNPGESTSIYEVMDNA